MIDGAHRALLLGYTTGLIAAFVVGVRLASKAPGRPLCDRLALAVLPASGYIVACAAFLIAWKAPENPWNGARLAPSVGLWYGERLYSGPTKGAVLNTIYPPMAFLPFLPTGLCSRPAAAVFTGSWICMSLVYGPFLALCLVPWRTHEREGASRLLRYGVFLAFCAWAMNSSTLFSAAHWVHADAPALGFAALACLALNAVHTRPDLPYSAAVAAGVCAALSIGSKQTMAPLAPVLFCWVGLTKGRGAALRFGIVLSACLLATSMLFLAVFGRSRMLFNIVTLPSRHPWKYQGVEALTGVIVLFIELFYACFPILLTILLLLVLQGRQECAAQAEATGSGSRRMAMCPGWGLFAAAAMAQVPMSLLGKIKVGGLINSDAPPHYLLCLACALLLLDRRSQRPRFSDGALAVIILASFASPVVLLPGRAFAEIKSLRPWTDTPDERAFAYAQAHPGEAFFPWNPLGSLLAEGRLAHFEYGLIDRDYAGFPVGPEQFQRHLPARLRCLAFPPNPQSELTLRALPEFRRRIKVPELPGWICYER